MKATIAVAKRVGILMSKRSALATGSQMRKRVTDEIMTADQYPRQREPTIDVTRVAQMSQTMMGVFLRSILSEGGGSENSIVG